MRNRFSLLVLALALALGAVTSHASAAPPGPPSVSLLPGAGGELIVVRVQADARAALYIKETSAGPQTAFDLAGFERSTAAGSPDLPVVRRLVEIPAGATYRLETSAPRSETATLAELGLPQTVCPVGALQPKCGGPVAEAAPDPAVYGRAGFYPPEPVRIVGEQTARGHRLLVLEFWPVAYQPSSGTLRFTPELEARIRLEGDLRAGMGVQPASPEFEAALAGQVLNYSASAAQASALAGRGGYLIVTADGYYGGAALEKLRALKTAEGYDVRVISRSQAGGSADAIRQTIRSNYQGWSPTYLLLVGDVPAATDAASSPYLLPSSRVYASTPTLYEHINPNLATDLYYGALDGAEDFVPDMLTGRLPARDPLQLQVMVDNLAAYVTSAPAAGWLRSASFLSTSDAKTTDGVVNWQMVENTHNEMIARYTSPWNFSGTFPSFQPGGDRLYSVTYGAGNPQAMDAFNRGRGLIVYSGHGAATFWERPYWNQSHIRSLIPGGARSVVASFACVTGQYSLGESLGETWLLQPGRGAAAFFGSSDNSFWGHDDLLERSLFAALFDTAAQPASLGSAAHSALAQVERVYGAPGVRPNTGRYYWETYNLLGDPSLQVKLLDDGNDFALQPADTSLEACAGGEAGTSLAVDSLGGSSAPVSLALSGLPPGVTAAWSESTLAPGASSDLSLSAAADAAPGSYGLTIFAGNGQQAQQAGLSLQVEDIPDAALAQPQDGAAGQPLRPTFTWSEGGGNDTFQLAADLDFTDVLVEAAGLSEPRYTLNLDLAPGGTYYWRVRPASAACGEGEFTSVRSFQVSADLVAPKTGHPVYLPFIAR